jgi:crotonobetainyl-CoA:carnitine CoA-transferase CaiB-like acyl-CoA transferase
MALAARERSGEGQFVDVSMLDSMISAMASNYAYFMSSGVVPRPMGTAFSTIVPYRTFSTADRDIAIAVASDKLWAGLCRAIGRTDLEAHPEYATNALRVKYRGSLEPLLVAIFGGAPAAEWVQRLHAEGVPCALVRTLAEVAEDPQVAVREMFAEVNHPVAGPFRVTGPPVKLSATPGHVGQAAPGLGEHTRTALAELLGLRAEELNEMAATGIIHVEA